MGGAERGAARDSGDIMRDKHCRIGRLFFLYLLCGLFAIHVEARGTAPATNNASSRSDPMELLKAGKYAELDAQMNGIQAAYEHGKTDDITVQNAFRAFYGPDPSLEPYYVAWIKRYPNSYAAHLALGIYYKYQGREARGGAYASETSQGRFNLMDLAFASALPELNKSLALTQKPTVTYVHLMDIAAHAGDRSTADAELNAANRTDPHNFIVRMKYMEVMRPRWLGRPGDMQAFYDRCKADHLSQAQLDILQVVILEDDASIRQDNDADNTVVRDEYAKAIAFAAPHASWLSPGEYEDMLEQASSLSFQIKDYKAAFKYADLGIKVAPNSADMFKLHGVSNIELGRNKEAAVDLETSANLGNEWSQLYVGELYAKGEIVPKDLRKARGFFEAAAKQGSKEATQNLEVLDHWEATSKRQ
jgi:hypothetical protein